MAVTIAYGFVLGDEIEITSGTSSADAAGLADGGVAVTAVNVATNRTTTFDDQIEQEGQTGNLSGTAPSVSQLDNGDIVTVADAGSFIRFAITGQDGSSVVGSTPVNPISGTVLLPDVAGLINGQFAIVYQQDLGTTDGDIKVAVYDNEGNTLTEFTVEESAEDDVAPSIAALQDGGFAVAWHRNVGPESELWYAVYNANGSERLGPTLLDDIGDVNRNASVVGTADGGFAIAYEDDDYSNGANIDITLARFDADGNLLTFGNLTDTNSNDTLPSLTVLSNGMFVVGTVDDTEADTNVRYTLADEFGDRIGSFISNSTPFDDTDPTVAATALGQVATVFTNAGEGELVGRILQATRIHTGDGLANTLIGDDLRDVMNGGGGADTMRGGLNADIMSGGAGADTFIVSGQETGGGNLSGGADPVLIGKFISVETINGGADLDRILVTSDVAPVTSLVGVNIASIEEIEFDENSQEAQSVTIAASDIGVGLAANLLIDGNSGGLQDKFRVEMGDAVSVNMSAFRFQQFTTSSPENDRVIVLGDDSNETVIGTSIRDEIFTLTGNDTLIGGKGGDYLSGGSGFDTASYSTATSGVTVSLIVPSRNTGDAAGDTFNSIENLIGSAQNDTLEGSIGKNTLNGGVGNDVLIGGLNADRLEGGAGLDTASYARATEGVTVSLANATINTGEAAGDIFVSIESVIGSNFADAINGDNNANTINGGGGADKMKGYGGLDTLTGGAGKDLFYFVAALNASTNVGTITDFNVVDDTIVLENAVFTALTKTGALAANQFKNLDLGAVDSDDRILYDRDQGDLFYDRDGSGTTYARVKFADIQNEAALTAADFLVI